MLCLVDQIGDLHIVLVLRTMKIQANPLQTPAMLALSANESKVRSKDGESNRQFERHCRPQPGVGPRQFRLITQQLIRSLPVRDWVLSSKLSVAYLPRYIPYS